MAENRECWHSRYQSTKGIPTRTTRARARGLLLGTDFRHAVEFSRNGRARTPAFRPSLVTNFPMLHRAAGGLSSPTRGPLGGLTRRRNEVTCVPGTCQTSTTVTP